MVFDVFIKMNTYGLVQVLDWAEGDNWHYAHFCVMNQGGIRAGIEPGSKKSDDLNIFIGVFGICIFCYYKTNKCL